MKKIKTGWFQTGLFLSIALLMLTLLARLAITPNNDVAQTRKSGSYKILTDVEYETVEDESAPTGLRRVFRFTVEEGIEHDSTLVFRFSHQNAHVTLDGEEIYSLHAAKELLPVRTPGSNWAMIPLYREDSEKEIVVELTPIYENYQKQNIKFYVGSSFAICMEQFLEELPQMLLSAIDIIAGLLMLLAALYFTFKKENGTRFYALSLLAVSLGIWNLAQSDFLPFVLPGHTTLLYYLSLSMLMTCVIPLIRSLQRPRTNRSHAMLQIWCILCGVVILAQLILQLIGIADLREMLKLTHGLIAVSSLVLIAASLTDTVANRKHHKTHGTRSRVNGLWLLGLGALIDLVLYYVRSSTSGLFFVLLAILLYVLNEGVQIFFSYTRQKDMLEEKETQLVLSRITTMMNQIRSHFVFNILNAISGMCKYDPERADETIVRFSRYLRNNIDIMEDDNPVPFSTELSHLEDYVVLEQVRFGDKIEFFSDVKTDHFVIPPLILQPIVENAIKHGLTKKPTNGTVILRTWEEDDSIYITVTDDGVGFDPAQPVDSQSVGLKNIRYRLEHLMHGTMNIESNPGVGTTVTLTIPKKEAEPCTSSM